MDDLDTRTRSVISVNILQSINPLVPGVPYLGPRQAVEDTDQNAVERGVWSGSTLFANMNFYQKNRIKMKTYTGHPLNKNGLIQLIKDGTAH